MSFLKTSLSGGTTIKREHPELIPEEKLGLLEVSPSWNERSSAYTSHDTARKFVSALKQCSKTKDLESGRRLHLDAVAASCHNNKYVAAALISMYTKCGSLHCARKVFENAVHRDVVTWNCLLTGYVENGESSLAMELFARIDCEPTYVTYIAALKACAGLATQKELEKHLCLRKGINIHEQIKRFGFDSEIIVSNTLVDMYCKCGSMHLARDTFNKMKKKDVVSWNILLMGYVENGESAESVNMFTAMECEPTDVTYVAALKGCATMAVETECKEFHLQRGMAIHEQVRCRGFECNIVVANTLMDMYAKYGMMQHAREIFDRVVHKDVVTWTCLILGYVENHESLHALDLFTKMDCEAGPVTYVAVLKGCGSLGALQVGRYIHARVCRIGLEDTQVVAGTLVDSYGKCGNVVRAEGLFNNMQSPDTVSYTALLAGYSSLGHSFQVFNLAKQMQESGLQMNGVTFMCILTACSHAGLVEEGMKYMGAMHSYGISPCLEHYNCMVDMLCRVNRLEEAFLIVTNMPFEADTFTWTTLLGACRKWKNLKVGKAAFDALVVKNDAAAYVLMGDIYGSSSMGQD